MRRRFIPVTKSVSDLTAPLPIETVDGRVKLALVPHVSAGDLPATKRRTGIPGGLYRIGDAPDLSVVDGREQPFQETVDGLPIDPANHGHEIVLRIDIDHVGAVADVGKCGGRST